MTRFQGLRMSEGLSFAVTEERMPRVAWGNRFRRSGLPPRQREDEGLYFAAEQKNPGSIKGQGKLPNIQDDIRLRRVAPVPLP